jgi:hypothetical protein
MVDISPECVVFGWMGKCVIKPSRSPRNALEAAAGPPKR